MIFIINFDLDDLKKKQHMFEILKVILMIKYDMHDFKQLSVFKIKSDTND